MLLNLNVKVFTLIKCQELQTSIDVIIKLNPHFKRTIRFKFVTFIISSVIVKVFIAYNNKISNNKNFLFESDCA